MTQTGEPRRAEIDIFVFVFSNLSTRRHDLKGRAFSAGVFVFSGALMYLGILAGLTTCALWGLTFVASRAVAPFSAFDIAAGRYGLFGLACALLMIFVPRFRPVGLGKDLWLRGIFLGSIGYVGYFLFASIAVKQAGAVIPPLITGMMPVFLPIIANYRENSISWNTLALPLGLITAGLAVANAGAIAGLTASGAASIVSGSLWATVALFVWIAYGYFNSQIMRRPDAPNALHWTGVQGIGAGLAAVLITPGVSFSTFAVATSHELLNFAGWAVFMAFAGSWVATWCWVAASRRLPLALSAQLIIAETIFGLIFGLMFEKRMPTNMEATGAALQIAGVCMAVYAFGRKPSTLDPAA
jgi:drug/metabolite transporter (DMT)-like permease